MRLTRLLIWIACYAGLLSAYNYGYASVQAWLIDDLQLRPAAWILERLTGRGPISVGDGILSGPRVRMEVRRGCDGVEAWLIVVSAFLVAALPWRRRVAGALAGTLLIGGLNVARLVSLHQLALWRPEWFDVVHGMVWQSLMVVAASAFVLIWLRPGEDA